jgi:WD40 repeat protein
VYTQPQAHFASVSSLLSTAKDNRRYLISGSFDYSIKVWLIRDKRFAIFQEILIFSSLEFVWKFEHHCGPITHLMNPPVAHLSLSIASSWRNCFFSISDDRTVGLFSIENMNK